MCEISRNFLLGLALVAAIHACSADSNVPPDSDSSAGFIDAAVDAGADADGSADVVDEPLCDPATVDDCDCESEPVSLQQCCWSGQTYACTHESSRLPGRPPTQFEYEYEESVAVDDCSSLPLCPLTVEN